MRSTLKSTTQDAEGMYAPGLNLLLHGTAALRVGVMCTVGPLRFMPFLAAFRMAQPGIEFTIVEGTPGTLKSALDAGGIDVAVMAQPDAFDARFNVHLLYREKFALACPPGHRLADRRRVALQDIDGENYVERVNCEFSERITKMLDERAIVVRTVYESEREDWVQMMVMSGAGVAMMPEYSILLPGLRIRPIADPAIEREICLVSPAAREPYRASSIFIKKIKRFSWNI